MSIKYIIGTRARNSFFKLFLMMMVLYGSVTIHAQETPTNLQGAVQNIKIGGNVYGGGNAGNTGGSATVTVRMGDIDGNVFGGARMANVAGSTFVNIDGEHAPDNTFILINRVYGGNDIAGTIGTSTTIPTELTGVIKDGMTEEQKKGKNDIDNTWNAFVRVSSAAEGSNQRGYIGQLFGGGNGEYYYRNNGGMHEIYESEDDVTNGKDPIATTTEDFIQPSIDRTYLEIVGGSIVYAYGGGNNATINQKTVIYVDNSSHVVNSIEEDKSVSGTEQDVQLLTMERIKRMGINTTFSYPTSGEYQIGSFFGGNNKADMAIRPTWNLKKGKIRNIYSGGNEGRMTSPDGLLLEIREDSELEADYIYGGCRKADVRPLDAGGNDVATVNNLYGYYFPGGYAARTLIRGGKHINHVYGGNDISGRVYFGSALGIYTTIYGDVYGGGNGSYPYTDNSNLKGDLIYGDFYYGDFKTDNNYTSSVAALNDFRPNAEQVSLRLAGTETKKTIIHGGVYVGGNSATLKPTSANSVSELKIGSYVIADKVFLGNNGENMVKYNEAVVDQTTQEVKENEGVLLTYTRTNLTGDNSKFTSLDLTNKETFAAYMDGCAMTTKPSVVFDDKLKGDPDTYIDYTTYIGSFFCGGNVGSITTDGKLSLNINHPLVIFDKLVGGSNNAVVPEQSDFNAEYVGGIIGSPEDGTNDKIEINLAGLKIEPKRWAVQRDADYNIVKDANNNPQYLTDNGNHYLEWNTQLNDKDCAPVTSGATPENPITSNPDDNKRRLVGGNIYGGCCESGVVNGNVILNLNASIVERFKLFDEVEKNADDGEDRLYGDNPLYPDQYHITERRTGVIMSEQGMDVLGKALNVFGGGKGAATEIWGSTTINMNKGYVFQVFGGSEEGIIGKPGANDELTYDEAYSCHVNLKGAAPGVSKKEAYNENMPECEFIYGGSFMGKIAGNTVVRLGNGRIFNSFAGSCYADILGHTETYIGYRHTYKDETGNEVTVDGFPWVRDYTYGGNDLGGHILGTKSFADNNHLYVRQETDGMRYVETALTASAYTEYRQGRAVGIFGGAYGTYDYKSEYNSYTNQPFLGNAFINFRPTNTDELKSNVNNVIDEIYGAGQGYPGDGDADKMQNSSYILIDIPQDMNNFKSTKVFGAGAWSGLGIKENVPADDSNDATKIAARNGVSAIIDLVRGQLATAYGGSYREGVTRRSVINVPKGSTIAIGSIFGGAYGTDTFSPCDVYEANVNYNSADAILIYDPATNERYQGAIYGGNNHERRTLYGRVNIGSKVVQKKVIQYKDEIKGMEKGQELTTTATIYGAGRGANTWSEYTLVNLQNGAEVYEVYGGGQNGKVFNAESIENYIIKQKPTKWPSGSLRAGEDYTYDQWKYAWTLGGSLDVDGWDASWPENANYNPATKHYWQSSKVNLKNPLVRRCEVEDRRFPGVSDADKALVANRNNTNVIINEGAKVNNYAYGGGYGKPAIVSGTTYIALLGGEVMKDIYAGGTSGSVEDVFGAGVYSATNASGFVANATAYIQGGTVRNVYGGGWRGSVGHHGDGSTISDVANNTSDRDGESHVVIGKVNGTSYTDGIPSITRNVYGGGEGGAIFGDAYVTVNNGYIGYRYNPSGTDTQTTTDIDEKYEPELDDATPGDNLLDKGGNVFGGGYVANSYVDRSYVTMYGGIVRGSLYGGGEVGPIGRGTVKEGATAPTGTFINANAKIYKGGQANVYLYDGHVMRDVFGGGRGYDNWGGEGWMTDEEKETMDKSSKGYVFGSTNVYIRGGEVGTEQGAFHGYGNVFGGGNEGFVYSATGKKMGTPQRDDQLENGKPSDGGGFYYTDGVINNGLSLDCNVEVEPYCKVFGSSVTIGSDAYPVGSYVPVEAMNKLKNKTADSDRWSHLYKGDNKDGIVIHNAIFAGGNITEGSDKLFANTTTVYGNVAASLRDVFNRDLISIGTDELGGIYGDGNLTLVDGFRELHIDNYGTDYYSLDQNVDYSAYSQMSDREKAYYQLKYVAKDTHTYTYWESKSLHTYNTVAYRKGQKITEEQYNALEDEEKPYWSQGTRHYSGETDNKDEIDDVEWSLMDAAEQAHWDLAGVFSIYAGRPMNTIQRADMCGVFGSRMVLKGAQDRVPQVVDYNDYTINRVDEVSLNKRTSEDGDNVTHGNYFGIYNSVNYLGNLTSDVRFQTDADVRETTSTSHPGDNSTTYYNWKKSNPQSSYRNNGTSHNKVALASGVYLEIKREETETLGTDDWGFITGVVELDLINVMQGMGGGYVYAKNEHGEKTYHSEYDKVTLLSYNQNAATYRKFTYAEGSKQVIETSGNFVHPGKQIVDDCYPNSGMYTDGYVASPAHYWFIKGTIYVYDQYISAYTGSANAYAEKVELPLTIAAASNGKLTLREVQPNYYAYYDKMGKKLGSEGAEETLVIKNKTYHLNDPISYWDYRLLSDADKDFFEEETYTTIANCTVGSGNVAVSTGHVMLPGNNSTEDTYEYYKNLALSKVLEEGKPAVKYVHNTTTGEDVPFDFVFRPSNNLGHNTGYILTFDINNPGVWNSYYRKIADASESEKLSTKGYNDLASGQSDYIKGPTFTPKAGKNNVYGQKPYKKGTIINNTVKTTYDNNVLTHLTDAEKEAQAQVEEAYVVTGEIEVKDANNNVVQILNPGVAISRHSGYPVSADAMANYTEAQWTAITGSGKAELATVCTSLLEFDATDYVWAGKVLSSAEVASLQTKIRAKYGNNWTESQYTNYFKSVFEKAYYCYQDGPYGGSYFEAGKAYRALETFSAMSKKDRDKFDFNYDALDLLVDPTYSGRLEANYGEKPQYDGWDINGSKISDKALNTKIYSVSQPVDYTAECTVACSYTDEKGATVSYSVNANPENWLTREQYEDIPNEKRYYSPVIVKAAGYYYVVKNVFMRGDIPYTAGQQIDESVYNSLTTDQKANVDVFNFAGTYAGSEENPKTYYYCHQSYRVNEKGEGETIYTLPISKIGDSTAEEKTYSSGVLVDKGVIIRENTEGDKVGYNGLTNHQTGFIIHGTSPTEVSTLYVSSESDIYDLSKEKIITVIYLYEYEESDASGLNVTPISERHIVNIHINFKSGVPQIDQLKDPSVVLPGTTVVLETPTFSEGAYRVTESGWELFTNQSDAETHTNGQEFRNNETPMYWYQNGYWVAYYAKTYLGKTYSNPVQFKVANYHDLKKVMGDKQHHYFIDHQDVDYAPKIYINNYKVVNEQGQETAESKNGLDLLKQLFDLTYANTAIDGHQPLDSRIRGGNNLEFFLRTNLDHTGTGWTPIANNETECFSGILHGDGHTITGLDHSFINHLCGDVYNLGVTGSFTSAGVAETGEGYVENCWISTSSTDAKTSKPVFHYPTKNNYVQIVNSYYMEEDGATNKYENHSGTYGIPTRKPAKAFYNGEVTYDLNGFYLYKRYNDGVHTASGVDYKYYTLDENGNVLNPQTPLQGYYANNMSQALCSSGYNGIKYVEDRFADGDFVYANGTIPEEADRRLVTDGNGNPVLDGNGKLQYLPIWPTDYLFFGQTLNYGHVENVSHEDVPSAVDATNRVFRAPAYFGSKTMSVAHFNPNAIFAKTKKGDATVKAYEGMTAIDFTGCNDATYQLGWSGNKFYTPLLDDGGLTDFTNVDLTSNLLAYTGTATDEATQTNTVVAGKLTDKAYAEVNTTYHTVAPVTDVIRGHWVQKVESNYVATRDHFLVDKEDFNAPIRYDFDNSHRMWYQRMPDNFVEPVFEEETRTTKGWEGISLPFTAEMVTTNSKGEITHFYKSASDDASENDKGHEYWLRKYEGGALKTGSSNIFVATFNKPAAAGTEENKDYKNSFLWDYYYSHNTFNDLNSDDYPGTYYKPDPENDNIVKTYMHYPRLACATPYIIGFPGERYYEFDLSGNFEAKTAKATTPAKLSAQVITFASNTGETIHVSDTELTNGMVSASSSYAFVPNFASKTLTGVAYMLNTDDETVDNRGNSYKKVASGAQTVPFRPYFIATSNSAREKTRSIIFSDEQTQLQGKDDDHDLRGEDTYSLSIYAKRNKIFVESNLRETTEVRIVNTAGITITSFDIEPGETVETRIYNSGVYIVQTSDGRYNKKLAVR